MSQRQNLDVIGFGALNYDTLCIVNKIGEEGEEIAVKEIRDSPGGSAANTIVGLARLGIKTGFIGILGNDREGDVIYKNFEDEKVDTSGIRITRGRTGTVFGLVDADGERTLYPYPGVNDKLQLDGINIGYAKKAKILHMTSFIKSEQINVQKLLISELSENTKISFSPGMIYAEKGLEELLPIIEKSYIVFLNRNEIKILTGNDYDKGSKILIERGTKIVVVTSESKGSYVTTQKDCFQVAAHPTEKVVDTTGAGDAFAAGFLYGLLKKGDDLEFCAEIGNKVASYCIRHYGAIGGLPYYKDIFNTLGDWQTHLIKWDRDTPEI
jgi:ribokinase